MRVLGHLLALFFVGILSLALCAAAPEPDFPKEGFLSADVNHGVDPAIDYQHFTGRVSDRDEAGRLFKVQVETNNTKFFRAGDEAWFRVGEADEGRCKAFVRAVEDHYFSMYVENLEPCWPSKDYFRRGMVLKFESPVLGQRVFEAAKHRESLILKKEDFLKQLNGINHFLWSFDQEKVKVAAEYDLRLLEMQKARQRALDELVQHKQEQAVLQQELMKRLNETDEALRFYRVERSELLTDRWNQDHDAGLPVGRRPQETKLP